jgi:nucleotide-binding universal stress UspA family protein
MPSPGYGPVMMRRILLALDSTESGQLAVAYAGALAAEVDASVHVIHVNRYAGGGQKALPGQDAVRLVKAAMHRLREAGVDASGSVTSATGWQIAARLAEAAQEQQADAIVTGSHRRRGLARWRAGGVRDRLTTLTWLPVLIAPAPLGRSLRKGAIERETDLPATTHA